jgi:hypothetical protein
MMPATRGVTTREQGASMSTGIFAVLRRTALFAAVALAAVGLTVSLTSPGHPQGASRQVLAQAQVVPPKKKSTEAVDESAMTRCMDTWDRATQMSKEEWRESCKRSIQENPGLYTKPF